jgi:hypothetical protein
MPETTFLHIRSNDESASRVLELCEPSVRVGRGSQCEIRLREPALAEVQCFLRKRGQSWHVQPVGPSGRLSIEGRPIESSVALAPGVPLRVCDHWLTLRPAGAEAAGLGSFSSPIPVEPVEVRPTETLSLPPVDDARVAEAAADAERVRQDRIRADQEQRELWAKRRRDELRWAARWQAAAEAVRARAAQAAPKRPVRDTEPPRTTATARPAQSEPRIPVGPRASEEMPSREYRAPVSRYTHPKQPATPATPSDPQWRANDERANKEQLKATSETIPATVARAIEMHVTVRREDTPASSIPVIPESETKPVPEPLPESEQARDDSQTPTAGVSEAPAHSAAAAAFDAYASAEMPRARVSSRPLKPPQDEVRAEPAPLAPPVVPNSAEFPGPRVSRRPFKPPRDEVRGGPTPLAPPVIPSAEENWPSAKSIIAAHRAQLARAAPRSATASRKKPASEKPAARDRRTVAAPTESLEPATWTLPLWLAWPVSAFVALFVGGLGIALACVCSQDDRVAGSVGNGLLNAQVLPDGIKVDSELPSPAWWSSTAEHLYLQAIAAERSEDPDRLDKVRFYLHAALNAAPANASAKLAAARQSKMDPGAEAISPVDLSQDAVALAWSGREALAAGDADRALAAFQKALDIAARAESSAADCVFDDDLESHRFRLPGEALLRPIFADMAGRGEWSFAHWSAAIPPTAEAWLAAYRVLRERDSADARKALEKAASLEPPPAPYSKAAHLAAQGEVLAFLNQRSEGAERYREALGLAAPSAITRCWWFNLAEILGRQGDAQAREEAWDRAVLGAAASEEVARQVPLAREKAGLGAKKRFAQRAGNASASDLRPPK